MRVYVSGIIFKLKYTYADSMTESLYLSIQLKPLITNEYR